MFDAYHKWLGIPPGEGRRPPSHYQMLGIARHEQDPEVIESAAIRQMAYVRNFQSGPHAKDCARILGELSQARLILRDAAKRAEYDARLAALDAPAFTPPAPPPPVVETSPEGVGPARRQRASSGGLGRLALVACALAGVAFLGLKTFRPSTFSSSTPPAAAKAPDAPTPVAGKGQTAANPPQSPAVPSSAVYEIVTVPPRASLSTAGMTVKITPDPLRGRTLVEVPEADGKRPLQLTTAAPGFQDFKQVLVPKPGERRALRFQMDPKAEAPPVAFVATTTEASKSATPTPNGLSKPSSPAPVSVDEDEDTPRPEPKVITSEAVRFKDTFGPIRCLAFHPEGLRAVTGHDDGGLRLWNVPKGAFLKRLDGHKAAVTGVDFSDDGRLIVSGGGDGMVRLWDAKSGKAGPRRPMAKADVRAVAFGPGGFLVGAAAGEVAIFDFARPRPLKSWDVGVGTWVTGLAVSNKARLVLIGDSNGRCQVRDAESGNRTQTFPPTEGAVGAVGGVALDEDGRRALVADSDGTINLRDARTGLILRRFKGHSGAVPGLAFSPDGRRVLSCGEDRTVRLWDAKSGFETHRFEGHTGPVTCVAFSPDGLQALSGGLDKTLRLWDLPAPDEPAESP